MRTITITVQKRGVNLVDTMKEADRQLNEKLRELAKNGEYYYVHTISHNSGFVGHEGYFATVMAGLRQEPN